MKPFARRRLIALLLIAGYDQSALGMPTFCTEKRGIQPAAGFGGPERFCAAPPVVIQPLTTG